MFKHVFSQLEETLNSLELFESISKIERYLSSPLRVLGEVSKRGGFPSLPWAQLPMWCIHLVVMSHLKWRGGTTTLVVANL